jgi:glutamine amidotransferase
MLAMINMQVGNLQSVLQAFRRIGTELELTDRPEGVAAARALILPGVGAFGDGMESLREKGLVEPLRRHVLEKKRLLLGICLGMQLLADESEEHGRHTGLGLITGRVVRLRPTTRECRVPNMGWCDVTLVDPARSRFAPAAHGSAFYFAHSYHLVCADPGDVAATIDYSGQSLTAAVERNTLFGVQFHPEKSQDAGLDVLASFVKCL